MAQQNPAGNSDSPPTQLRVALCSGRTLLVSELLAHVALPPHASWETITAPEHGSADATTCLRIIDLEDGQDWRPLFGSHTPVLALGGQDKTSGGNSGTAPDAVRYLSFPLSLRLVTQSIATLFPPPMRITDAVALGNHALYHPQSRCLSPVADPDAIVELTQKEADFLLRLLAFPGEATSRETLLDEVWGYDERMASHTLETHLYRLRQKLKDAQADDVQIVTRDGALALVIEGRTPD